MFFSLLVFFWKFLILFCVIFLVFYNLFTHFKMFEWRVGCLKISTKISLKFFFSQWFSLFETFFSEEMSGKLIGILNDSLESITNLIHKNYSLKDFKFGLIWIEATLRYFVIRRQDQLILIFSKYLRGSKLFDWNMLN